MFEFNLTGIVQTLQSVDYYSVIYTMITTTYLELLIFTIGIFLYAVFIWFFYKNLGKRDLFKLDLSKYDLPEEKHGGLKKAVSTFLYILKYGIIFPFYIAFWFVVFSIFLFVLAKNVTVRQIALISIAMVSAVRITSYLNEDLSHDLAKLTPLALLGVFLIDPNFFSWDLLIARLGLIPSLGLELLYFLSFSILLEWVLRILCSIKGAGSRKSSPKENQ